MAHKKYLREPQLVAKLTQGIDDAAHFMLPLTSYQKVWEDLSQSPDFKRQPHYVRYGLRMLYDHFWRHCWVLVEHVLLGPDGRSFFKGIPEQDDWLKESDEYKQSITHYYVYKADKTRIFIPPNPLSKDKE